jgi:glyoxylase-like metal-dependent hydrolase (beta-lactamase superfamily II)
MTDPRAPLGWNTFVAPAKLSFSDDLPPGSQQRLWSPTTATLIFGERDAILVDAPLTITEAKVIGGWIAASGKNLTTIYATHGHGDHFFGIGMLLEQFPGARAVATAPVVARMREQSSPATLDGFWNKRFPGQIPGNLRVADELPGNELTLEGQRLIVVPLGHTDTDDTTCLHVPSIGLVVAGDAAYNGVHPLLAESTSRTRGEWLAALDTIESLAPRAVIAGHKDPEHGDDPAILGETRAYIRDFDRLVGQTRTPHELYERMLQLYPGRINSGALWVSARAVQQSRESQ